MSYYVPSAELNVFVEIFATHAQTLPALTGAFQEATVYATMNDAAQDKVPPLTGQLYFSIYNEVSLELSPLSGAFRFDPQPTIVGSLQPFEAAFSALVGTTTSLSGSLSKLTAVFDGGTFGITSSIPSLTSSFTGAVGKLGDMSVILPSLEAAVSGNITPVGSINKSLKRLQGAMTGVVGGIGGLSATLADFDFASTAYSGRSGSVVVSFPELTGSLQGCRAPAATLRIKTSHLHGEFRA